MSAKPKKLIVKKTKAEIPVEPKPEPKPNPKFILNLRKLDIIEKKLSVEEQKKLVNKWVDNILFTESLKLDIELTENELKRLITKKLKLEESLELNISDNPLKENEYGFIKLGFTNIIIIRKFSNEPIIQTFLSIINDNLDDKITKESIVDELKKYDNTKSDKIIKSLSFEHPLKNTISIVVFKTLLDILSNISKMNTMILFKNTFDLNNLFNIIENQALIGININQSNIEKIEFYKIESENTESFLEYDFYNKILKTTEPEIIEDEPKTETRIEPRVEMRLELKRNTIYVDPKDIGKNLPVIRIETKDLEFYNYKDIEFIKGESGNIYTNTSDNYLIGKIVNDKLFLIENFELYLN